jgi:uncharacterized membrane protein YccC
MCFAQKRGSHELDELETAWRILKRGAQHARRVRSSQIAAAGWCVVVALFLTVVQFTVRTPPPLPLYLAFVAVWLFGAGMLVAYPTFGAIGTMLYGVLLGTQLLVMHGLDTLEVTLAGACFVGSALALWTLVERRRSLKA